MINAIIETERLYFRKFTAADDVNILELDADPEVHEYLGQKPIQSLSEAQAVISFIIKQYVDNGIGRLAIIEKETGNFIGWGGFKLITEPTNQHLNYHDLGYRFIKKYWGKGYATESAKATIKYGFEQLDLKTIYAIADVNNIQSRKVLEKCGFICKEVFDYELMPHHWFELNASQLTIGIKYQR